MGGVNSTQPRNRAAKFFGEPKGNLIGKDVVPALTGETVPVLDPATGELLMTTPASSRHDVDRAVTVAQQAFDTGPWRRMTPFERSRIIVKLADLVERHQEELAEIEALDAGKPITQARYVDVPLSLHVFHFYAGLVSTLGGRTIQPSVPYLPGVPMHAYTVREPLGVVGLITPFNFPLLLGSMKIAPALAAGCTLVLKPDERTPASSLRLAELALEAGVPEGVFNVVCGGPDAGAALAAHDRVAKVAFTGSTEAGRSVLAAAAGNLKKVSLELGGNSANIIFADADLPRAVEGAAAAAFTNAGETCTAGARLFVEDAVHDEVVAALARQASGLKVGLTLDDGTQLGPLITEEHLAKVLRSIETAKQDGGTIVTGGRRIRRAGFYMEGTVVSGARATGKFMSEEVFGPVAKVTRFADFDDVIAESNRSQYGLAAGLWTRDLSRAHRAAAALQAGTVWVNCYNVFHTTLPFGGYKQSGWGRESCPEALDLYTEVKTVCVAL